MPPSLARRVAAFNRRITNPVLGPIVWYLPGFGRIEHLGRRSGRLRSAPMMAFPSRDRRRMVFALTYGPDAEWVRNALAAGWVDFESRWSGRVHLVEPRVVHDPARRAVPSPVRAALGVMGVDDFLEAVVAVGPSAGAPTGDGTA
jgi:deazaflavin-dependent oxidoreductase (nitroreductase family)